MNKLGNRIINTAFILIGLAGLLVGTMVYLTDRPPGSTYFVNFIGINTSLTNFSSRVFGPFGSNLPSFIHVFSFILITAGLLARNKKGYFLVCLIWFFIDISFELGQKFNIHASNIIPRWFEGIPFFENTRKYFLLGTFDLFDIVAIASGTLVAYLLILMLTKGGNYHEKKE